MIYVYGELYVSNSYGTKCEYELVRRLNDQGIPAKIVCCRDVSDEEIKSNPIPDIYKDFLVLNRHLPINDQDIVIYTENIHGNPLNGNKIVRWLLNRSCSANEDVFYSDKELLYAYSYLISDKLPQLFILLDEVGLFQDIRNTTRKRPGSVCVYFGKIYRNRAVQKKDILSGIIQQYKHVHVITRNTPESREEALSVIASSELFISFDGLTNLNYEATLLGTPAFIIDDYYGIKNKKFNVNTSGFAFSPNEIDVANKRLGDVWNSYLSYFDHYGTELQDIFIKIDEKFENLQYSEEYAVQNRKINELIMAEDKQLFHQSFKEEPMTHVWYYSDIPTDLQSVLTKNPKIKILYLSQIFKRKLKSVLIEVGIYERFKCWKNEAYNSQSAELNWIQKSYLKIAGLFRKIIQSKK